MWHKARHGNEKQIRKAFEDFRGQDPQGRPLLRRRPDGPSGGDPERPEPQHRQPALPRPAGTHPACLRGPAPVGRRNRRKLRAAGPAQMRRLRQDRRLRHLRASGPSPRSSRTAQSLLSKALSGAGWTRAPSSTPMAGAATTAWSTSATATSGSTRDEFTRGTVHINGIEGFRGLAKVRLTKFKGLPRHTLRRTCGANLLI